MSNQIKNHKSKTETYELVLGLEIHMQLNTSMKMFCSCANKPFGSKPNTHVCPVCLGLPGAMPVPNKEAIEKAQTMADALGSHLREEIVFERKNYFYPDLPKAYQITTPHYPVSEGGEYEVLFPVAPRHPRADGDPIEIPPPAGGGMTTDAGIKVGAETTIHWREIHLEEDTAKSMHKDGKTWIDYNKSGVSLLEMVTEPDFHSVEQAVQFAKEIQWFARYLDVSDADMEKGNLRLEANISMKRANGSQLTAHSLPDYRVELKNINSFTFMKKALEAEIKRQTEALDKGEKLVQETRGYNEDKKMTFSQRGKEEAHDYRYFPEPDIPLIRLTADGSRLTAQTPRDYVNKLKKKGVKNSYLPVIVADKALAEFVLKAVELGGKEEISVNAIAGEVVNRKIDPGKITPDELIASLKKATASMVSDESQLEEWVRKAMEESPKAVEDVRAGKMAAIGALIGSVMKYSKGKANAKKVQDIVKRLV